MALAHSPIPGIGVFYSGMLHPLRVAAHLLALLGLALLLGQTGLQKSRFALGTFSVGLVLGLPVLIYDPEWAGRGIETLLLTLAAVIGVWVASARRMLPGLLQVLAFVIAAAVIADSMQEGVPAPKLVSADSGALVGAFLTVVNVGTLVELLKPNWTVIGVRIAGSWIAAASFMVLALKVRAMQA